MITQPLHQRLQDVANAIAYGYDLRPLGATYDGHDVVTITTRRGRAAFHYRDIHTIIKAGQDQARERRPNVPPVTVAVPVPKFRHFVSPKSPATLAPVETAKAMVDLLEEAKAAPRRKDGRLVIRLPFGQAVVYQGDSMMEELQTCARTAFRPWSPCSARNFTQCSAPRRAVGNFTSAESTERTLDDLRHNLAEARKSGHEPLVKVMQQALSDAMAIAKGDRLGRLLMKGASPIERR